MQNPYELSNAKKESKVANIEVLGMKNYSITKNGINSITTAKRVLKYDTYDEFYDVSMLRRRKEVLLEKLQADTGTLVKNDLTLVGNVKYKNSNGVKFKSEEAQYNLNTKVFKTDKNFILEDNRTITHGSSLVYQTKKGKIDAENIRSIIEVDKK
jgi:LPS export ABC transporter protein LptC